MLRTQVIVVEPAGLAIRVREGGAGALGVKVEILAKLGECVWPET